MIITLLQVAAAIVIALLLQWGCWALFEKTAWPPRWLAYKPWACQICFQYWTSIAIFATFFFVFNLKTLGVVGAILAVLQALAQKIDEHNHTVSIYDDEE